MRVLLGAKSGHLKLRYYLHTRLQIGSIALCEFCGVNEDIGRIIGFCQKPGRIDLRLQLQAIARQVYREQMIENLDQGLQRWRMPDIDLQDSVFYIFPYRLEPDRQRQIHYELVNYVAYCTRQIAS